MATDFVQKPITLKAGADLSARQNCAVVLNDTNQVVAATANGIADFILLNAPDASGKSAVVAGPGEIVRAKYGGTVDVSANANLKVGTDGRLIAAAAGTAAIVVARALEDGVVDGVYRVLWLGHHGTVS